MGVDVGVYMEKREQDGTFQPLRLYGKSTDGTYSIMPIWQGGREAVSLTKALDDLGFVTRPSFKSISKEIREDFLAGPYEEEDDDEDEEVPVRCISLHALKAFASHGCDTGGWVADSNFDKNGPIDNTSWVPYEDFRRMEPSVQAAIVRDMRYQTWCDPDKPLALSKEILRRCEVAKALAEDFSYEQEGDYRVVFLLSY